MAGIYVGGAPKSFDRSAGDELNGVIRAALLSAQHLLRERFEKRVAWVDGHWEWRREPANVPLPPEARKKVADVSRLFEILTNAQFRDREPLTKPSGQSSSSDAFERRLRTPAEMQNDDSSFLVCTLVLLATLAVWACAALLLSRDANRRRVQQLKQRINGWFTKKAAAADGQTETEQTPPRDDPPPPYCDGSAEPFLPPGGTSETTSGTGDLPPPYSSCDAPPNSKEANDQLQSLMGGENTGSIMPQIVADPGSTISEVSGVEAGKTDDQGSKSDSGKVLCDSSLVVVV